MTYLLALDQGTTSSRAIVFDDAGQAIARAQREIALHYPHPGWVETDPLQLWQSQLEVAREAMTAVPAGSVVALGIANQRETVLLWERASGQPLHNAIVWQDRRTASVCERLRAQGHADVVGSTTGLLLDPYFSATKLAWLLEHIPGARARAERGELCFGTVDSWLIYQLTGGALHATDPSNASRTLLFNLATGQWDERMLDLFAIPRRLLPSIVDSSGVCGHTQAHWFGQPIPIAGIAGDQQAATFGQACFQAGSAKSTYGTGCFLLQNSGAQPAAASADSLRTVGWRIAGATTYLAEGSVFMGGATVQWLRDGLGIIGHSSEVEALAASVDDCGGVVLVPAFTGLGAPYWDPQARASVLGMTRGSRGAHVARAALESIGWQVADVLDAMVNTSASALPHLRADGGACGNDLLMQMQADMLGVPVLRPRVTETTALGAAYLAGLACQVWPDQAAIGAQWQLDRAFEPSWSSDRRQAGMARWRRAVAHARAWKEQEAA